MPRKNVSSEEMNRVLRNSGSTEALSWGEIPPAARMALISEAKRISPSVTA